MKNGKNNHSVLEDNNHSVFLLNYLLILTTSDLLDILDERKSERLKEIFDSISKNYNITRSGWNCYRDHIEIMFKAHPKSELSKFINAYKSAGSRRIKSEFPEMEEKLKKGQFWSKSFCLFSLGQLDPDIIQQYIRKQGPGAKRKYNKGGKIK